MKRYFSLLAVVMIALFTSCNKPDVKVEVDPVLDSEKTEFTIGAEGGPIEITVNTNLDITAQSSDSWLACEATRVPAPEGLPEEKIFRLTAEENTSTEMRSATVTIKGGDLKVEIIVNQNGCDPELTNAGESTFNVPAEGQNIEVKVTTNIDYKVDCGAEWISQVTTKASRTDVLTFTVAPNPGEPRDAQISISYDKITVSVYVSQASAPFATVVVPENIPCVTGLGVTFDYQLTGEIPEGTKVDVEGNGWIAEVTPGEDGTTGTVRLQAPELATEADVNIVVSDNLGVRSTQKLDINLIQQGARMEFYAYHCFDRKTPFTHDRFVKMGEAGVRVSHSFSPSDFEAAAEAAQGADVKLVGYMEDYIYNFVNWGDEDYKSYISQDQALIDRVNMYKSHDNLWGYNLIDEPRDSLFVKIGMLTDRLHELDPDHPTYVNLWGDQMNDATLTDYIRDAHPNQVCFDHYAVTSGNADAHWYTRLESLFRMCTSTGIPWWGFAASADINDVPPGTTPPPTAGSLRLYHYTLLGYGATNLMYFTWLHYTGENGGRGWTVAPLMQDGTYSYVYDLVKEETKEIDNHMFIFRNSTFKGVRHSPRESYSTGVTKLKLENDPIMSDAVEWYEFRSGAIISLIENSGNEYLLIEGKSMGKDTKVSIGFKRDVWRVTREGWFEPVKWENGEPDNEYYFQLEPGEPLIIKTK
ncbi:MAG: BACON domain-containing protein [Bacteroidales bacterium]|nr:BACON domain-containing protein [Candidatus Equibacterium intestinale]